MKHYSVFQTDQEMLRALYEIHLQPRDILFDLDCTFSKGVMWQGIEDLKPRLKSDLVPINEEITECDTTKLSEKFYGLNSIVFDPPFLFRNRPSANNDKISERFSYFSSYEELCNMYKESLNQFMVVLNKRGYVFVKCQDMTDNGFYATHVMLINYAQLIGFKLIDIGIKLSKSKLQRDAKQQNCLAKVHTYWIVLKK